ncbi:MAG: hypothetical protein ACFB0C_17670 [Leptolyngbyaceae cyanobacterium]
MFNDELTPFKQDLVKQPVAFVGGFAAGLLRLDLSQDPVKSWLNDQGGVSVGDVDYIPPPIDGPTKISID